MKTFKKLLESEEEFKNAKTYVETHPIHKWAAPMMTQHGFEYKGLQNYWDTNWDQYSKLRKDGRAYHQVYIGHREWHYWNPKYSVGADVGNLDPTHAGKHDQLKDFLNVYGKEDLGESEDPVRSAHGELASDNKDLSAALHLAAKTHYEDNTPSSISRKLRKHPSEMVRCVAVHGEHLKTHKNEKEADKYLKAHGFTGKSRFDSDTDDGVTGWVGYDYGHPAAHEFGLHAICNVDYDKDGKPGKAHTTVHLI